MGRGGGRHQIEGPLSATQRTPDEPVWEILGQRRTHRERCHGIECVRVDLRGNERKDEVRNPAETSIPIASRRGPRMRKSDGMNVEQRGCARYRRGYVERSEHCGKQASSSVKFRTHGLSVWRYAIERDEVHAHARSPEAGPKDAITYQSSNRDQRGTAMRRPSA